YDKTYWNCITREIIEELKFKMKPERLQFIRVHGYLSHNRSGTQPATTNDNDYTKSPYYVEIAMYLYLVLPHEYSQIIYNEPNNMYPPQWMTKKQMDH
ncbi:4591_t:CDS:1, partial [Dentiscutata erythropus]